MKKKVIILIIVILIVLLIIVAGFIFNKKDTNKQKNEESINYSQEQMKEKIDSINDNMLSRNPDLELVSKEVGYEVSDAWAFLGPGSLYEFKLSKDVKNGKSYEKYEKIQDDCVEKISEAVSNNFEYEIIKHETTQYSVIETIKVKSFYGILYSLDQNELMNKILEMGGYNPEFMITNDEWQIAYYKAKIKSIQILNEHMDFYINKNEYYTFQLIYDITDSGLVCYNCNDYFELLKGNKSSKVDMSTEDSSSKFYKEQNIRIEEYINEAIKNKILDRNNPFSI